MVFDSRLQFNELCDLWNTYNIKTEEKARTLLNYFVKGPGAVEGE